MKCKEIQGLEHLHMIFNDDETCATCGLSEPTFTKLDELNEKKIPCSNHCSECGKGIELGTRFKNFALRIGTETLHTLCEECRIKMRQIRPRKKECLA